MTLGRKNWLFAGSNDGGRAAAVLFTMVEAAKRAGVEVMTWLADALSRINETPATELGNLLPDRWKPLRHNAAMRQAVEAAARRAARDANTH